MAWLGGLKGFYFGTSTRNSFSQRFPLPLASFLILASFSFIPVTPHRSNAQCMATNQTRSGSSFWPKTKTRNQKPNSCIQLCFFGFFSPLQYQLFIHVTRMHDSDACLIAYVRACIFTAIYIHACCGSRLLYRYQPIQPYPIHYRISR